MESKPSANPQGILSQLKQAYATGGARGFYETHLNAARASTPYRLITNVIDVAFPLFGICEFATRFDAEIPDYGLYSAANRFLDRIGIPRTVRYMDEAPLLPEKTPLVLYSNHSSAVGAPLVITACNRTDVKVLAMDYVSTLGPNLGAHVLPVRPGSTPGMQREHLRHPQMIVELTLRRLLEQKQPVEQLRAANRAVLRAGADHVMSGGCLIISPEGGDANGTKWFPGLGKVLLTAAHDAPDLDIVLMPVNIRNDPDVRRLYTMSTHKTHRWVTRRASSKPVDVTFGRRMHLADAIAEGGTEPVPLVAYLQRQYRATFSK